MANREASKVKRACRRLERALLTDNNRGMKTFFSRVNLRYKLEDCNKPLPVDLQIRAVELASTSWAHLIQPTKDVTFLHKAIHGL